MKSSLDYLNGHLCILNESELGASSAGGGLGSIREWYAVREAAEAEVATLVGRPVTRVESEEGLYVDEDGNPYQLSEREKSKPFAVKATTPGKEGNRSESRTTEARGDPDISAPDFSASPRSADSNRVRPKALLRKPKRNRRAAAREESNRLLDGPAMLAELPAQSADDQAAREKQPEDNPQSPPAPLNLRQKLAEVRRRIGYIQKRGFNERFNYRYVTAADIAGAVGDILAQLGVVVIPSLESIVYEPVKIGGAQVERVARVVMTYTFADVETAETVTVKVPGEGLDVGDKASYKAMTGALKYALLQSFLLATGDDPEEERLDSTDSSAQPRDARLERRVTADEISELTQLIDDTGTDLERVLTYYKVSSLEEMTKTVYRRATELLNRKRAAQAHREANHAQS